jgi:transcriptional regulator with XRE-family HTH domain
MIGSVAVRLAIMSNSWIDAITAEMQQRQMSRRLLASRIHLTEGAFNHYLHGRRDVPFVVAQHIEQVLGVPLDLWYASRGRVPDDLIDRYGTEGLAQQFQRMREDAHV